MSRPAGNPPRRRFTLPTATGWLHTACLVFGVVLGALAIVLIVLAGSQKQMSIGIVVGLWGLFLALSGVGGRAPGAAPSVAPVPASTGRHAVHDADDEPAALAGLDPQLIAVLRQEVQLAVRGEFAALRAELGRAGQVRLERIETRLIGADLDALQQRNVVDIGTVATDDRDSVGRDSVATAETGHVGRRRRADDERSEVLERLLGR